ncbi:MAG: DUF5357 family protein [Cyanobacteria bacterium J06638_20]
MNTLQSIIQELWNQLKPPQAFSWQTLVWLSIFSWCLSYLTNLPSPASPEGPELISELVREILAWMGWFFLTLGIAWGLWGNKLNVFFGWYIRPAPWISGAMVCLLLFRGAEDNEALPFPLALTIWPLVSAAIAIVPRLFPYLTFKLPTPEIRRELIILFMVSLLMSCWFRFHFLLQDWLAGYPSIVTDDLSRSGFVIRVADPESIPDPRGFEHLSELNQLLQDDIDGQPWAVAERWLLERDDNIQAFQEQVHRNQQGFVEDIYWRFQSIVPPQQPRPTEYILNLRASWGGPASQPGGYFLEQTCLVRQVADPDLLRQGADPQTAIAAPIAQLDCEPINTTKMWLIPLNTTGGVG